MPGEVAGMVMTKRCFLALGIVALVGSSCDVKKMSATLGGLVDLQKKLQAELGEDEIGVHVMNDVRLTITLKNSPSAKLAPPDKEKKARSIAAFAYANYADQAKLAAVGVVFMNESNFLVLHSRRTAGSSSSR